MNISITYDSSVAGAPTGFTAAVAYAVNYLDSLFTNTVAININVGWGEVDGQALAANALGESSAANYYAVPYSQAVAALQAQGAPGSAALPAASPFAGTLAMSSAEAKALGLIGPSAAVDGYVGIGSGFSYGYTPGKAPSGGFYYLIGVIEHEITEDMGRVSLLDQQPTYYSAMDLFRYSAPGVRDLATGGPGSLAYFSTDGGLTNRGTWNNNASNGDLGDWYPNGPAAGGNDALNDYTYSGVVSAFSASDLTLMNALGWTSGATASAPSVSAIVEGPATGVVPAGAIVTLQLNMNVVATVSGAPTLTLSNGATATYAGGSGTQTLTFTYVVGAGDAASPSLTVSAVNLNGGAITDESGLALDLALGGLSQSGPQISPLAPVITAQAISVYEGHAVAASSLIGAVSNPRGDTISKYAFLDTGSGGGHLTLGGVTQAANSWVTVTTAALATVQYVGGTTPGSQTLEVELYDATLGTWSAVASAAAATLAPVNVSNTAAWVSANLDSLQASYAAGGLGTVTLTDGGTPTVAIAGAQLAADAGALSRIAGTWSLSVSGPVSAAAAAGVSSTLRGRLTTPLGVSDLAAAVVASLAGLQTLAAAGKLAAITLTDAAAPTLAITAAQLGADTTALGAISGDFTLSVSGTLAAAAAVKVPAALLADLTGPLAVSDTGANVTANLAKLQTLAAAGHLASIALTGAGVTTLAVTAAQLAADTAALALITTPIALSVSGAVTAAARLSPALIADLAAPLTVSDSATNVLANLAALQALAAGGRLASIALTTAGTPVLTLSAAQLAADGGALGLISTAHTLTVTGVAAADAASVAATAHVTQLSVSDSAANVSASLDALQAVAAAGQLTAVALTDGGAPVLSLAAGQLATDATALGKIAGTWSIAASGSLGAAAAAGLSGTLRGKLTTALTVSDAAAAVTAGLAGLQTLAAAGKLASITLTDATRPTLAITTAQLSADAQTLGLITSPLWLSVSGTIGAAAAVKISATLAGDITGGLAVADTAANVKTNLSKLQTLAAEGALAGITLTDAATPAMALTTSLLKADAAALAAIASPFVLTASGTSSAFNSETVGEMAVSGSALDITDLAAAKAGGTFAENAAGTAGTLTLTDGTHTLSLTLLGQFAAAGWTGAATAAGFVTAPDAGTGTTLTWNAALAPPH